MSLSVRVVSVVFALCWSASGLTAQAGHVDSTVYTTMAVTLREQPNLHARIVARIPAATPLRMATCAKGWCEVGFSGLSGYVRRSALSTKRPPPTNHAP